MTRSRVDRAKILRYTLLYDARAWWNNLSAWRQIFILAGLVCAFELLVLRAVYPLLEQAVI